VSRLSRSVFGGLPLFKVLVNLIAHTATFQVRVDGDEPK